MAKSDINQNDRSSMAYHRECQAYDSVIKCYLIFSNLHRRPEACFHGFLIAFGPILIVLILKLQIQLQKKILLSNRPISLRIGCSERQKRRSMRLTTVAVIGSARDRPEKSPLQPHFLGYSPIPNGESEFLSMKVEQRRR